MGRGTRTPHPRSGPKFLHFHTVFGKNLPNNRLAAPSQVGPRLENPRSATGYYGKTRFGCQIDVNFCGTENIVHKESLSEGNTGLESEAAHAVPCFHILCISECEDRSL